MGTHLYHALLQSDLLFLAHTSAPPSASEWDGVIQMLDRADPSKPWRWLVISDGGGPSPKQCRQIDDKIARNPKNRSAYVSDSAAARALITGTSWKNGDTLATFGSREFASICEHIEATESEVQLLRKAIGTAVRTLGLKIFSDAHLTSISRKKNAPTPGMAAQNSDRRSG